MSHAPSQAKPLMKKLRLRRGDLLVVSLDAAKDPRDLVNIAQSWAKFQNETGVLVALVPTGQTVEAMPYEMLERAYLTCKSARECGTPLTRIAPAAPRV